jgi:hypothetical protein
MAPKLAVLTDAYRRAIADYLGQHDETAPAGRRGGRAPAAPQKPGVADMVKKLDALDAQRWKIEAAIKPDALTP